MALPNLLDVTRVSEAKGTKMKKKVIKAAKASKKVEELTKKETKKGRSAKDVRAAMYGAKD